MEPLLSNIERNPDIAPIRSFTLAANLPKTYAYADDVNATIKDCPTSLKALFKEYERLTNASGLELNANKTELMRMGSSIEKEYNVSYLDSSVVIKSISKVKINGIFFQRNVSDMEKDNIEAICEKIDKQFRTWSKRSLTTLGKILIVKTFGISQIIFLMQCMSISDASYKKLNAFLYKFIWNRHYLAAKAPERIKRTITNLPIKLGGLGMLDIAALDESLKLKALGRILNTSHPFLKLVSEKLDLNEFFDPKLDITCESVTLKGVELLRKDRSTLWSKELLTNNSNLLKAVREASCKAIVSKEGQRSIAFFLLWRRGARKIKDLTLNDFHALRRFIDRNKLDLAQKASNIQLGNLEDRVLKGYFIKDKIVSLASLTSKEIRVARSNHEPIRAFKIGLNLSELDAQSWSLKVAKVKSTRHQNILLRVAHGDIYTNEKLFRFGMHDTPECPRCRESDSLQHKFVECDYVKRIWAEAYKYTAATNNPLNINPTEAILGAYKDSSVATVTLNAEIILRISCLKPDNYQVHPKFFVKAAVATVLRNERQGEVKDMIKSIWDSIVN